MKAQISRIQSSSPRNNTYLLKNEMFIKIEKKKIVHLMFNSLEIVVSRTKRHSKTLVNSTHKFVYVKRLYLAGTNV